MLNVLKERRTKNYFVEDEKINFRREKKYIDFKL